MTDKRTTPMPSSDPMGDALSRLLGAVLVVLVALSAAPLLIPLAVNRLVPDMIATKTRFWMVHLRLQWCPLGHLRAMSSWVNVDWTWHRDARLCATTEVASSR